MENTVRNKIIMAASLNRLILFASKQAYEDYIAKLDERKRVYEILSKQELEDGAVRLLIKEQYNNSELL